MPTLQQGTQRDGKDVRQDDSLSRVQAACDGSPPASKTSFAGYLRRSIHTAMHGTGIGVCRPNDDLACENSAIAQQFNVVVIIG